MNTCSTSFVWCDVALLRRLVCCAAVRSITFMFIALSTSISRFSVMWCDVMWLRTFYQIGLWICVLVPPLNVPIPIRLLGHFLAISATTARPSQHIVQSINQKILSTRSDTWAKSWRHYPPTWVKTRGIDCSCRTGQCRPRHRHETPNDANAILNSLGLHV